MRTFLALSWLFVSFFVFVSLSLAAESDLDKLLDLLVEKRVVTKEDAAALRADLAIKKQEEKEKQKEFTVGAGKPIKISGYTQDRYQILEGKNKIDGFDIRRARLDIKGEVTKRFDYRAQAELGGTKGPFLLDATISYKFKPYLKLIAGQFKVPFSQENLISSPKLETINRSQVVEALIARGRDVIGNQNGRDLGVQAGGSFWQRDDRYLFDYAVGLFNGAGVNAADGNEEKDTVGRIVLHPVGGLDVGGSYYNGRGTWKPNPKDPKSVPVDQNRDRIGVEFAYLHEPLSLKGEYVAGKDSTTKRDGWYLQAGYFFFPKKLQGVVKLDTFDFNTKVSKNETNVYTVGVNWYVNKWAFLQVSYELKDERGQEIDNNALIEQFTLQF